VSCDHDPVASTFQCLGLDVAEDLEAFRGFMGRLAAVAVPIGSWDGVTVARWQDPSGVRLTFAIRGGEILDFVPGYDGPPGGWFSSFEPLNEAVVAVSVDQDGEQVTGMVVELEERHLLPAWPDLSAQVSITALGVGVQLHRDVEAFAESDASLLTPDSKEEPAPENAPLDLQWPLRVSEESFFANGLWTDPANARSDARFSGIVLDSARHIVEATDRSIVVCRVRTMGFEANVCLPGAYTEPEPGQVVAGTVWLSASLTPLPRLPVSPARP
jgi:hypothetical protein